MASESDPSNCFSALQLPRKAGTTPRTLTPPPPEKAGTDYTSRGGRSCGAVPRETLVSSVLNQSGQRVQRAVLGPSRGGESWVSSRRAPGRALCPAAWALAGDARGRALGRRLQASSLHAGRRGACCGFGPARLLSCLGSVCKWVAVRPAAWEHSLPGTSHWKLETTAGVLCPGPARQPRPQVPALKSPGSLHTPQGLQGAFWKDLGSRAPVKL